MALDPDFLADCPYGPEGLLIDEILLVDREQDLIRARMPTSADLPLTRTQRVHPVRHPRHVNGGLMVHMTGMMGFAHAYFLLGLRHSEGWIGYGAKITSAHFKALAPPGEPLVLECRATRTRKGAANLVARYSFAFHQNDKLIYEGDQTAYWMNVNAPAKASA